MIDKGNAVGVTIQVLPENLDDATFNYGVDGDFDTGESVVVEKVQPGETIRALARPEEGEQLVVIRTFVVGEN